MIKTFGSKGGVGRVCDVVELEFVRTGLPSFSIPLVVVPHICDPVVVRPIDVSRRSYKHLVGLELADSGDVQGQLPIDILIGSDYYWKLVTGRVVMGGDGSHSS